MKTIIAELDYESLDELFEWHIRPLLWVVDDDDKPSVTIRLFHGCDGEPNPCGMVNRDEFLAGDMPEYDCDKCGESAPVPIVEEKLLAQKRYEGYDPRNNRRAAVLATKNKGSQNVRD